MAYDIHKERRQRLRKLVRHPQLRELVIEQLKTPWSPEQIAGRLLADGVSAVRVCSETIYRFIYGKEDQALELHQHLAEGRSKRRPPAARGNPVTALFRLPAGYRNALISLVIVRSSGIGRATC
ncbi:hypothetical protein [Ensifer adhaerens]